MGDRYQMAMELRSRLGLRMVTVDVWGPMVHWPSVRDQTTGRIDKIVSHYDGGSSVLEAMKRYSEPGLDGTIWNTRRVDRFHKVVRGWANGFAYGAALCPWSGYILEGRSFWKRWGAHTGDAEGDGILENDEGFPIYWSLGAPDEPTPAVVDAYGLLADALEAIAGFKLPEIGHYQIGSDATACPGSKIMRVLGGGSPIIDPEDEDMDEYIKGVQRSLIAAGYDPGPVDGRFGPRTEAAMAARDRDARDGYRVDHVHRLLVEHPRTTGGVRKWRDETPLEDE